MRSVLFGLAIASGLVLGFAPHVTRAQEPDFPVDSYSGDSVTPSDFGNANAGSADSGYQLPADYNSSYNTTDYWSNGGDPNSLNDPTASWKDTVSDSNPSQAPGSFQQPSGFWGTTMGQGLSSWFGSLFGGRGF